jgi:hypothetical protein
MHLFADCEIVRGHWRGTNAVLIVGDRAVTPEEARALLAQFAASFGPDQTPVYFSRDGWQFIAQTPFADGGYLGAKVGRLGEPGVVHSEMVVSQDAAEQLAKWAQIPPADEVLEQPVQPLAEPAPDEAQKRGPGRPRKL